MTTVHSHGTRSIARRISLLGGAFLLAVLAAICSVMTVMLLQRAHERTVSWVDAKVQALVQGLDAYDQTAKLMVERFFKVFGDQFGKHFTLDEAGGRLLQLGIALNGYHNHADKFSAITGGVAMVLMKRGDAFVAINGSLVDEHGERVLDLSVNATHPAHAALLRGEAHTGRGILSTRSYIVRMQPVHDLQQRVVGALLVAFDLSEFDRALDRTVSATRLWDSGGAYVVDPGEGTQPPRIVLPVALQGRPLQAGDDGADALNRLRAAPAGGEVHGLAPVLSPEGDRFAVARRSDATGQWVVAEVARAEAARGEWLTLWPFLALFAAAAAALCLGLYLLIRRWVAQPLQAVTGALERVSGGDLSQPVQSDRHDEVGVLMHGVERMRQRFVEMLGAVRVSVDAIAAASREIAGGNMDLSRRTDQAAAQLQQAAASLEQLHGSVRAAEQAARAADDLAGGASNAAEQGGGAVGEVACTMGRIAASSERIAEITSMIDGIAFQTNILALNAAVEAARAGDSGRGFAVVAGEVRGLAQRAASAALEIKALIDSSAEEVRTGARLADAATARMQEIVDRVRRVSDTLASINTSASRQSEGLGQVNASVATLDRMTQQNAALVEQSAAAAASLQAQADRLVEAVAVFRLADDNGVAT